ncbi:MAG: serine protease, partial [Pseudomonadota bacterium]
MIFKKQSLLALILIGFIPGMIGLNTHAKDDSDKIINGMPASTNMYPWMAYLFIANADDPTEGNACGGSLIAPQWVLTAAHCFNNAAGNATDLTTGTRTTVQLGSDTVEPLAVGGVAVMSSRVIIHPNYNPGAGDDFDIALLELQTPVTGRPVVSLMSSTAPPLTESMQLIVMGWGATAVSASNQAINSSNSLLQTTQRYFSNDGCNLLYGGSITDNMLCANGLSATDNSDSCQGDSGGPIVLPSGTSFIQVGASSFGGANNGPVCGDPTIPGVYARISAVNDFIRQNVPDAMFAVPAGTTTPMDPNLPPAPMDPNLPPAPTD